MGILAANVKVHYTGIGSALALRAVGYLFGNILAIILQNMVQNHSEGQLVCAFILTAIGNNLSNINKNT